MYNLVIIGYRGPIATVPFSKGDYSKAEKCIREYFLEEYEDEIVNFKVEEGEKGVYLASFHALKESKDETFDPEYDIYEFKMFKVKSYS